MITLKIGASSYDLSSYVDESSIVYGDNIDETMAHGGFTIPYIKPNAISGVDMSLPLSRLSQIETDIDDEIMRWFVAEDRVVKIRKGTNPLYSHEITLVEPTVVLQKRVLPNMTVTQPKGTIDNYAYLVANVQESQKEDIYQINANDIILATDQLGVKISNAQTTISFDYGTSTDTAVIEDNELKEIREYEINITGCVYNIQYVYNETDNPETTFQINVYANSTLLDIFYYNMNAGILSGFFTVKITPFIKFFQNKIFYTPSGVGELITVKVNTIGDYRTGVQDKLFVTRLGLSILTFDEEAVSPKIMLDEVVDKILYIQKQTPLDYTFVQEFSLSEKTRAKIGSVVSPEFTFKDYTMYDALTECAQYVGAQVYLGEEDYTTIEFAFFDEEYDEQNIDYVDEEQNVYLNDYITGLEINAQNVIKEDNLRYVKYEPTDTSWASIRAKDIGQITDENATVYTAQPIYKNYSFLVKGMEFEMLDSVDTPVAFANTIEWELNAFVVEQTKWSSLENVGSGNSRSAILNKGNTLYYTQGEQNINNIGYNDVDLAPAWNTALAANYAVVEAILCKAQADNPTYHFSTDYKPTISLFDLRFRTGYMPYSNARITVYRDDFADLNESTKYFNEQASLNDMKSLGDIAKKHVNRKGNAISTYRGITKDIGNLIHLGMKNSANEILSSYSVAVSPTIRELVLNYSKDNPNINAYKGTPSAYRQYQVPITDLVYRKDKYTEYIYLYETLDPSSKETIYDNDHFLVNFTPSPTGQKLNYAKISLDFNGTGYTDIVEASVDTMSFGNTAAIIVEMQTNYSAGPKQKSGTWLAGAQIFQDDTPYVDEYGQVKKVKVQLYKTATISAPNTYPSNTETPSDVQSTIELNIYKDAREVWGLNQEMVFYSKLSNIKIFSGMAKFNGFVCNGDSVQCVPFLLKEGYFPTTEIIDMEKLIQVAWTSSIGATYAFLTTEFTAPAGTFEGYIYIEVNTMTPIFAHQVSTFTQETPGTLTASVIAYSNKNL